MDGVLDSQLSGGGGDRMSRVWIRFREKSSGEMAAEVLSSVGGESGSGVMERHSGATRMVRLLCDWGRRGVVAVWVCVV